MPFPRILFVDDSKTNRVLMSTVCRRMGCDIDTCASGEEAVSLSQNYAYDIAFIDLNMPLINGTQTAKNLISKAKTAFPIYIISGFFMSQDEAAVHACGASGLIEKPLDREKIKTCLDRHNLSLDNSARQSTPTDVPAHLLHVYADELKVRSKQTRDYMNGGDYERLRKEAHTILGLGQMLHQTNLVETANALNEACELKDSMAVKNALSEMERICAAIIQVLEKAQTSSTG